MAEDITGRTFRALDLMLNFFADERRWFKSHYQNCSGHRYCLVGSAMHFSAKIGLPWDPVISLLQSAPPHRQVRNMVQGPSSDRRTTTSMRAKTGYDRNRGLLV